MAHLNKCVNQHKIYQTYPESEPIKVSQSKMLMVILSFCSLTKDNGATIFFSNPGACEQYIERSYILNNKQYNKNEIN